MKTAIAMLTVILVLGFVPGTADAKDAKDADGPTNFDREADGLSLQAGAGLVFWFPFAHLEARMPLAPRASASLFASAGYRVFRLTILGSTAEAAVVYGNAGAEARYHFVRGRFFDLHVGAGLGTLFAFSEAEANATPIVWANGGATLALFPRLMIDAELNGDYPLFTDTASDTRLLILPILRARILF